MCVGGVWVVWRGMIRWVHWGVGVVVMVVVGVVVVMVFGEGGGSLFYS